MLATGVTSSRKTQSAAFNEDAEAKIVRKIERLEQQLLETQRHGDLMEESRLCNNIAKLWEKLEAWKKALQFHQYDKQISVAVGDSEGYVLTVGNMAQVFLWYDAPMICQVIGSAWNCQRLQTIYIANSLPPHKSIK